MQNSKHLNSFYEKVIESPCIQANSLLGIIGPMNVKLENPVRLMDII